MISLLSARTLGVLSTLTLLILLTLTLLGEVPQSLFWIAFLIVLAFVLMRFTVRLVLQRDQRLHTISRKPKE